MVRFATGSMRGMAIGVDVMLASSCGRIAAVRSRLRPFACGNSAFMHRRMSYG